MKKKTLISGIVLQGVMLFPILPVCAQDKVVCTFNPQNVVLPSSQYTPDKPYQADVWVYNTGQRYEEQYYNKLWAVPDVDGQSRPWYAPDYDLTDGEVSWQVATAPFSSDEYYKGMKSFRWITSEIMGEIYLRRKFTLDGPVDTPLFLAVGHDDAPSEWYINGVLVHTVSDGWNNDEYVLLTDEQQALLKTDGTENVIAVHVHQNWGGAFADCGLYEADTTIEHPFLHTVADGAWDCRYYILNYNSDLSVAESAEWFAADEDESDWISGVGPFSNDENMFYTTEWPSQVRPILIRRHFTLTASDLESVAAGDVRMTCSYDENPKVYLNGTLIWSATGWNDNNYVDVSLSLVHKELLREGDNVLAVSLMQGGGGGHVDYGLRLVSDQLSTSITGPKVPSATDIKDNRVYNLNGQYLGTSTGSLSEGIYIVGGKKLVIGKKH